MRKALLLIPACLFCLALTAQEGNVSKSRRSFVTVDPLRMVMAKPGQNTPVEFTIHIQPGYHINSNRPSTPELIPTQLGFSPPMDLIVAKVQYPAGQLTSFPFSPEEKLSVYSGDIKIKAVLMAQRNAGSGNYTVHGELKYQACDNNSCYPPKKVPVQFDVNVAKAAGKRRGNAQSPHIH